MTTELTTDNPYGRETPLRTFLARAGDLAEIRQSFDAWLKAAAASGSDTGQTIDAARPERFLWKLSQLQSVVCDDVNAVSFYRVAGAAETSFRMLAAITYRAVTAEGKRRFRDLLALHKQGKETTDWTIRDVLWSDEGIGIDDVPLVQLEPPAAGDDTVVIETSVGPIRCRLFPERAPMAVANFKALAQAGYYDNFPFNRVYDNYVIQSGQLDGSGREAESSFNGFFDDEIATDLFNLRGALAMGNAGPNTNGNQIYIVQNKVCTEDDLLPGSQPDNVKAAYREIGGLPYLDGRFTIFGHVIDGMECVDEIAGQAADAAGMPLQEPVCIRQIIIEEKPGA